MHEEFDQSRYTWLSRLAFGLLLAIVIARCLMLEVAREATSISGTFASGPGATTSLVFDWLTFLPMLLILVRRLLDPAYLLRFKWVHITFALLALWTLASVAWSGDRFLALVGAMQVVSGASLFWSISQLARRWEHVRIVVGVCVGLLLANVVQALIYRSVDLPDLRQFFLQNKAQILAERGWVPGEFVATRFEQKLMAGELLGFNASPNTLGAIVVMLMLITLGAAMQRVEDRDDQGWIGIMFIAALSALYPLAYTNSKASWGALGVGIFMLALWRLLRRWLAAHRGFVFAVAIAAIALAIVSLVAVGLSLGGLPEDSLNFRWRYWLAAWASVYSSPIHGVGWANFASAFLEHRLPESAEEISDPHNFVVRWATELGVIGLALGLSWLVLWAWNTSRAITLSPIKSRPIRVERVLLIGVAAYLFSLAAVDWNNLDETGRFYAAVLEALRRILMIGLVTLALGILCLRDAEQREVDARPAPWLSAGLFVGAVAFLIQSSIDIAFFQPGPFMLCLLILGTLAGTSFIDKSPRRSAFTLTALISLAIAAVIILVAVVIPTAMAESNANYARRLTPNQPERAMALYEKAFTQAPVRNAEYLLHAGEIAKALGGEFDSHARVIFDRAIDADPTSIKALLARARWLSEHANTPDSVSQCQEDFRRAVLLNPHDIDLRIEFAGLLERFGKAKEAAAQLLAALETNDAYDPAEPERLELRQPGEPDRIRARIARLQSS